MIFEILTSWLLSLTSPFLPSRSFLFPFFSSSFPLFSRISFYFVSFFLSFRCIFFYFRLFPPLSSLSWLVLPQYAHLLIVPITSCLSMIDWGHSPAVTVLLIHSLQATGGHNAALLMYFNDAENNALFLRYLLFPPSPFLFIPSFFTFYIYFFSSWYLNSFSLSIF